MKRFLLPFFLFASSLFAQGVDIDGGDIASGTVADARIASTIARDAEVAAAYQPLDAALTSISGLTTAANKGIYTSALDTYATYDLTAAGRALAGVAGTANTFPYFSASNVASLASVTAAGLAILDDADATAQRATLGLSSMALQAASSVAITGGTINGTTIGASTPSSGAFTTGSFSSNLLVGGYGTFGSAADTGDARKVLAIGSTSTTDTIFEIRNTSTGGGTWQIRTGGQSGSSGLAVNEFGIYSGTLAAYPLKFAPTTGLATLTGDITSTIAGLTGTRTFFLSRDASNGAKFAYDNANNRTVITNMWDDGAGEAFRLVTRGAGTPFTALSITGIGAATLARDLAIGNTVDAGTLTINSGNISTLSLKDGGGSPREWQLMTSGNTFSIYDATSAVTPLSIAPVTGAATFSGDIAVNGGDITSTGSLTFTTASNGNVVVAPNGTGWLEVPQRIYRTSGDIQFGPTSGSLAFYTGGGEKARFNAAGELLIGAVSDAGTFKLQVTGDNWTSGKHVQAYSGGVLPTGDTLVNDLQVTGSGDAGGATNVYHTKMQVDVTGSNNVNQLRGLWVRSDANLTSGTLAVNAAAVHEFGTSAGGSVTNAIGVQSSARLRAGSTGNLVTVRNFLATAPNIQGSGFITGDITAYDTEDLGNALATKPVVITGFRAQNQTQGTGSVYGFKGEVAAAANKWNFYASGTAPSYFNGEVQIGSTTDAGAYALQVTGAGIFTGNLTVNAGSGTNTFTLRDAVLSKAAGSSMTLSTGLNPSADNALDLGASGARWATGYFGTGVNVSSGGGSAGLLTSIATNSTPYNLRLERSDIANANVAWYFDSSGNLKLDHRKTGVGFSFNTFDGGSVTIATNGAISTNGGVTVGTGGTAITKIRMVDATLVGGTVTVSDATIAAGTSITLASKTPGGTPGALFISSKTASTGYTITSTSATDTSVVTAIIYN